MSTIARRFLFASRACFGGALALWVMLWCVGAASIEMQTKAGGRPHHVDTLAGRYYVQEKEPLTEVTASTYTRLVLLEGLREGFPFGGVFALLGAAGVLLLASRGIEARRAKRS